MSTSSSRAVSMMIGTWLRARSRRQTSIPSIRGSITSRTTRSKRPLGELDRDPRGRRGRPRPRSPPCGAGTPEASESTPRRRRAGCEPKLRPWREVSFSGAPMFDPRIYRAALLPAARRRSSCSCSRSSRSRTRSERRSRPRRSTASEAARTARSIVALAPDRTPGSSRRPRGRRPRPGALLGDRGRRGLDAVVRLELRRRGRQARERHPDPAGDRPSGRSSSSPPATRPRDRARRRARRRRRPCSRSPTTSGARAASRR